MYSSEQTFFLPVARTYEDSHNSTLQTTSEIGCDLSGTHGFQGYEDRPWDGVITVDTGDGEKFVFACPLDDLYTWAMRICKDIEMGNMTALIAAQLDLRAEIRKADAVRTTKQGEYRRKAYSNEAEHGTASPQP